MGVKPIRACWKQFMMCLRGYLVCGGISFALALAPGWGYEAMGIPTGASFICIPHSAHCAKHSHVVRLEAVLSGPYVDVGPSKTWRADASALLSKTGGAANPHLCPLCRISLSLGCHVAPTLVAPFLASSEALGEQKGSSPAATVCLLF